MAAVPNPGGNGDVLSIFSHPLSEKLSVINKEYREPSIPIADLVTVTVDGFGAFDYRQTKKKTFPEEFENEEGEEGEEELDDNENKVIIQRYTFTNKNQMTVQVSR